MKVCVDYLLSKNKSFFITISLLLFFLVLRAFNLLIFNHIFLFKVTIIYFLYLAARRGLTVRRVAQLVPVIIFLVILYLYFWQSAYMHFSSLFYFFKFISLNNGRTFYSYPKSLRPNNTSTIW